jgi:hypothetical protein
VATKFNWARNGNRVQRNQNHDASSAALRHDLLLRATTAAAGRQVPGPAPWATLTSIEDVQWLPAVLRNGAFRLPRIPPTDLSRATVFPALFERRVWLTDYWSSGEDNADRFCADSENGLHCNLLHGDGTWSILWRSERAVDEDVFDCSEIFRSWDEASVGHNDGETVRSRAILSDGARPMGHVSVVRWPDHRSGSAFYGLYLENSLVYRDFLRHGDRWHSCPSQMLKRAPLTADFGTGLKSTER